MEIRRRILIAYEAAEREGDAERRAGWLTFVVVGGGPTGVELAGALGEISRETLRGQFDRIDPTEARVLLLEGLDRILPPYPPELSEKAARSLERLGVTVQTGTMVTGIDATGVTVKQGDTEERIPTRTVLWAAGVRASSLGEALREATGCELDKAGRVIVEPDLTVPGHPEIFVIGDLATFTHGRDKPLPGVAPVAIQQGRYVARHIENRFFAERTKAFEYDDRGNLATIGRASAVADLGRFKFGGVFAWLAWVFIHLINLIEFDRRILVLVQWATNYFTRKRGTRLITGGPLLPPLLDPEPDATDAPPRAAHVPGRVGRPVVEPDALAEAPERGEGVAERPARRGAVAAPPAPAPAAAAEP